MATDSATMLQPGQIIRPNMDENTAKDLVLRLYGLQVTKIRELNSYDDKNYKIEVAEAYSNPHIPALWPHGYILKVLNSMDSQKNHIAAEHEAQDILLKDGIVCPKPVLNIHGQDRQLEKIYSNNPENNNTNESSFKQHMVRMLTFIPGKMLVQVSYTPQLLYRCGNYVSRIEKSLKNWSHTALTKHQSIWNLISVPKLKDFLYAVTDEKRKELVQEVLDAFSAEVIPKLEHCQPGVIHGDFNEQNILVSPTKETRDKPESEVDHEVCGVIDFGDMMQSYYMFEVGTVIMYLMVESKIVDPLKVGGHVLAGYLTEMELYDVEWDLLKLCVAGRYCQSLVMGAYSYLQDPGNEYLLVTAANGWSQLDRLWKTPKEELYQGWRDVMATYTT